MSDERKEMFCSNCKEVVDSYEMNDGIDAPVWVDVCPKCGNQDLEDVDLEKLDIDWEIAEEVDVLSAYDTQVLLSGLDDNGNEYSASATESCGEIVEIEDIERI